MNGKTINRVLVVFTLFFWTAFVIGLALPAWSDESDYHGAYAGSYYGSGSGYDYGFWVAIAAPSSSDSVFLSYSQRDGFGDGGYLNYQGEAAGVGYYYSYSVINNSSIEADVNASGSVSGIWSNTYSGESGTFSGNAITSSPQEGTYSGSLSGDATGTWSMTVASNGYITGTINVEGATSSFEGGAHPDGYMVAIGTDSYGDDFSVFGRISGSSASGSWYSNSGDAGAFTTESGSGDGGGSGGGCFISSLTGK